MGEVSFQRRECVKATRRRKPPGRVNGLPASVACCFRGWGRRGAARALPDAAPTGQGRGRPGISIAGISVRASHDVPRTRGAFGRGTPDDFAPTPSQLTARGKKRRAAPAGWTLAAKQVPAALPPSFHKTSTACFCESKTNATRHAASEHGSRRGTRQKFGRRGLRSRGGFHRPKFLRGGCLDGSAAATTARNERHSEAEIVKARHEPQRCEAIEADAGGGGAEAVGRQRPGR